MSESNPNPNNIFKLPPKGHPEQPQRVAVDPNDTQAIVCPCGSQVFTNSYFLLRRVSPILGGDGRPKPMAIIACVKCLKPVPDFLPPGFSIDVDIEATVVSADAPPVKAKTEDEAKPS